MENRYSLTDIREWKKRNQFFFQIVDNKNPKNPKRISHTNKRDLYRMMDEIEKQIEDGIYGLEHPTLEVLFDLYMVDLKNRRKPPVQSTLDDYYYCSKYIFGMMIKGRYLKHFKINEITVPIATAINKLMNKTFSVRQNAQCFNLLGRMYRYAMGEEEIKINSDPFGSVVRADFHAIREDYKNNKKDPLLLQGGFDQCRKKVIGLLAALENYNYQHYTMVRLWLEAGNRPGEIYCLTVDDYDRELGTIFFNKTMNTAKNTLSDLPKTKTGVRTIVLSEKMQLILNRHLDELVFREGYKGNLLFPSERNTPIQNNNFSRRILNKFNKELGIKGKINPHSLRHLVVTLRSAYNQDKKQMMKDVGHASKQISDHYDHNLTNIPLKRQEANVIAGFLEH